MRTYVRTYANGFLFSSVLLYLYVPKRCCFRCKSKLLLGRKYAIFTSKRGYLLYLCHVTGDGMTSIILNFSRVRTCARTRKVFGNLPSPRHRVTKSQPTISIAGANIQHSKSELKTFAHFSVSFQKLLTILNYVFDF